MPIEVPILNQTDDIPADKKSILNAMMHQIHDSSAESTQFLTEVYNASAKQLHADTNPVYEPGRNQMQQLQDIFALQEQVGEEDIITATPIKNMSRMKDIVHEISYADSIEGKIRDKIDRNRMIDENPDLLTVDEAHNLSKEMGFELKYDKPVARGEVEFDVMKRRQKASLEQELAHYMQSGDVTALDNVLLAGAAMSGLLTATDLAVMGATSYLGGVGVAAALARFAKYAPSAVSVARAVKVAQKSVIAEKRANMYANSASRFAEIARERVGNIQQTAQSQDFLGKLIYDTYRFGKQVPGEHASLATTVVPFAIDGAVSELPRIMVSLSENDSNARETYAMKNALSDMLLAFGGGAVLPVAGTAVKQVPKLMGKVGGAVLNNIAKKMENTQIEASLKGHDVILEGVDNVVKESQKAEEEIVRIATEGEKIYPQADVAGESIRQANIKEDELQNIIMLYTKGLSEGKSVSQVIDSLPLTSRLTKIPGMLDFVTQAAERKLSADEFFSGLVERGYTKLLVRKEEDAFTSARNFMKGLGLQTTRLDGEVGLLGKYGVSGLSVPSAKDMLKNLYISKVLGNTEEGIEAGIAFENSLNKLHQLKRMIDEIRETNAEILEINKVGKREAGMYYPIYGNGESQNNAYALGNGEWGSIKAAVNKIADLLYPEDKMSQHLEIQDILNKLEQEKLATGRYTVPDAEIQEMKASLKELEDWRKEVREALLERHEKEYVNEKTGKKGKYEVFTIKRTDEIRKGQKRKTFLDEMSDSLDNSINENTELYNSDLILRQEFSGDPKALLEKVIRGEEPEYARTEITNLEMQNLAKDRTKSLERNVYEKRLYANSQESKAYQTVQAIHEGMAAQVTNRKRTRLEVGYTLGIKKSIDAIDGILSSDGSTMMEGVLKGLREHPYIGRVLTKKGVNTAEEFAELLARNEQNIREVFTTNIIDPILAKVPEGPFKDQVYEQLRETVLKFVDSFSDRTKMEFIMSEPNLATGKVQDLAKEAEKAVQQREDMAVLFKPLFTDISESLIDLQTGYYKTLNNEIAVWDRILKAPPGKMDEIALGELSTSILNSEGASLSLENLSRINEEIRYLRKSLASNTSFSDLEDFAYKQSNWESIQDATYNLARKEAGTLSEEEEKNIKWNSREYEAARTVLDELAKIQEKMYKVGAGKQSLISFFDPKKMRIAEQTLKTNMFSSNLYRLCKERGEGSVLARFLPMSQSNADMRRSNAALFMLEHLDLDGMFNKWGRGKRSWNAFRDSLLDGTVGEKYADEEATNLMTRIADTLLGDAEGKSVGYVNKLQMGSMDIANELRAQKAKYLEDLKENIMFKIPESQREAMKSWGYNSFAEWTDGMLSKGKRAYAILSKAGFEPLQFYRAQLDNMTYYANVIAPTKYGVDKAKKLIQRINGPYWRNRYLYLADKLCGAYEQPASVGIRFARLLVRTIGSPMIMKAGLKSLTDRAYTYQYLMTMGLATDTPNKTKARLIESTVRHVFRDDKLEKAMFMNQNIRANTVMEGLVGENSLFSLGTDLNQWADSIEKAEYISQRWTDILMNNMALIGPATEANRMAAANTLCLSLGDFASTRYAQMNRHLQDSLRRYGITEFEWDNILSKHGVMETDKYIEKIHGSNEHAVFGDNTLRFAPDLIAELDRDTVRKFMKKQGRTDLSDFAVDRYRDTLTDKAALLVNASADEMVSMPSERVKAALQLGISPNTKMGVFMQSVTQFQSFGAAVNFYHMGRRVASHMDPANPLFDSFLMQAMGWSSLRDMAGMITSLAMFELLVSEGISYIAGTHQKVVDDMGQVHWDILGSKIGKAYIAQTGVFGIMLDSMMGVFDKGRGSGGGISIPVLPTAGSVLKGGANIYNAATRKSTEGQRAQAIAAAVATNMAGTTGIPQHPFLQATWGLLIGDKLKEMQMGEEAYYNWLARRRKDNYAESLPQWLWDEANAR